MKNTKEFLERLNQQLRNIGTNEWYQINQNPYAATFTEAIPFTVSPAATSRNGLIISYGLSNVWHKSYTCTDYACSSELNRLPTVDQTYYACDGLGVLYFNCLLEAGQKGITRNYNSYLNNRVYTRMQFVAWCLKMKFSCLTENSIRNELLGIRGDPETVKLAQFSRLVDRPLKDVSLQVMADDFYERNVDVVCGYYRSTYAPSTEVKDSDGTPLYTMSAHTVSKLFCNTCGRHTSNLVDNKVCMWCLGF